MAKYQQTVTGDFDAIQNRLHQEIMGSAVSMNLVDESYVTMESTRVLTRVYDKYYFRANNRASLTVVVVSDGYAVSVTAIGSGGGTGVFFKFDWGAENNFVQTVARVMQEMGY